MYDFSSLSDYDFELLVRDLLQLEYGITLESFKRGRDSGIDLRYSASSNNELIIQCKHYSQSSFRSLENHLRRVERPKIERLNPERYVLATSLGLTPSNKEKLLQVCGPYCHSTGDIFGREDLNNLLGKFECVERRHFKLWLSSQRVLERLIHASTVTATELELQRLPDYLRCYVQNESYDRAVDILEKEHICVISGLPGIGKTMLAKALMVDYIMREFDIVKITSDIAEAYAMYKPGTRQLFYYDDFLGQTSLIAKLGKNEDKRLVEFLDHVRKTPHCRFILTTREYILNQAQQVYEPLNVPIFDRSKCIVELSDYTLLHRAKILANHIYFSSLPARAKSDFVKKRRYVDLVKHTNFSPRVIEWITDQGSRSIKTGAGFTRLAMKSLDHPHKLWEHAFENQIGDASRCLLLVIATFPNEIILEDARMAFNAFYTLKYKSLTSSDIARQFNFALKELDGTFLLCMKEDQTVIVCYHSPSVRDYIETYLAKNPDESELLCQSIVFFEQCLFFWHCVVIGGEIVVISEKPCSELGCFIEAVQRTCREPGCSFVRRSVFSGEPTRVLHSSLSIAPRLQYLFHLAIHSPNQYDPVLANDLLSLFIERMQPEGEPYGEESIEAVFEVILDAFETGIVGTLLQRDAVDTIVNLILQQINSIRDLTIVYQLWERDQSLIQTGTIESLKEYFLDLVGMEVEAVEYFEDVNELAELIDWIECLARWFAVDVEAALDVLRQCMDELEQQWISSPNMQKYKSDLAQSEELNTNIDELFNSLLG